MISDFLIDFYSEKVGEQLSQDKFDSIIEVYGNDYDSLINDLYSKYDTGNIDDEKLNVIKDHYSIKLPSKKPAETNVENPDFDYSRLIKDKKGAFDQGEFKMAEREAFEAYKETGEIDISLLPEEDVKNNRKYKYNEIGGEYYVDDIKLSRVELKDKLFDRDFISKLQEGEVDIKIKNDERLEVLAKKQLESGSEFGDKWEGLKAAGLSLGKSIISAPTFVEDVFAEVAGVENVFGDYERKKRDALVKSMTKDIDKLHESQRAYENDFRGSIASGNFVDAGSIGFNTVVESAPIMVASTAAAILSGGSSVVAQGLTSAGVMSALLIPGEYTESVFSEDEKVKDLSRKEKLARGFFRGLSEGFFEGIMGPAGGRAFGLFKSGLRSTAKTAAKQGGKEVGEVVAKEMANKTAVDVLKTFGIDSSKEGFTEALTSLSQDLTDDILGVQDLSISEYMSRASEAGALGVFMGGVIKATGGITTKAFDLLPLRNKKVYQGSITDIRKRQELGTMSKEEGDRIINDIEEYKSALEQTDSNLNEKEQNQIANLIYERNILEKDIKKLDPNQQSVKDAKVRVDNINKQISELSATDADIDLANKKIKVFENTSEIIDKDTDNRLDENIEFAKEEGKKFGLKTEIIDSQIKFTERFGKEAGRSDGFIENGVLYINKEVAKNTGAVTVGSHELLHGILNQAFKGKDAKNLVSEFKKRLNEKQLKAIDDRLLALDEKGDRLYSDEYLEANQDEVLTAFSDAIAKEEISYDENLFTKLMDVIVPILRKAGFAKIKFETGKDVYNFLKEYNKSIKEGKLSESISELSTEKIVDSGKKFSKSEVTDLAKQYKADPAKADVEQLVKQYNNVALKALGYDISKGTIAPEEAVSFVNKEFDSILRRYDGSTEFSTWVNSNIRPKQQAFYEEQIGKQSETTSIDSEQARQVVDDSETTTDDRTEKEIRQAERKTKVAKRLKLENKAVKEVSEKVKDIDLSKVNYKTLKNLANETIGDAFGISPKKILNNANLTKGEIASAQRYIKNNVDLLKALLPDGYNKDFKSTGVPKVLLDKFYNKRSVRAKTGAGLNVQTKKPNIGSTEFLEVFGFVEGKPTRDDRNISARIIALANQTGKAITNQTVREQLQKEGMPESALQDIKSGTPVGMFSRSKYKGFSIKEVDQLVEVAQASDINAAGVIANIPKGSITVTDKNRPSKVKQVLKDIIQFKLTLNTFESSMPASAGAVRFRVGKVPSLDKYLAENKIKSAEGDIWYKLTDGTYAKGVYNGKNINGVKTFGPPVDSNGKPLTNLTPARGRLYYGKEDPNYIEALKAAKNNTKKDTLKPKKISVKERITKAFIAKNKQSSIDNMKILKEVSLELNDAVNVGVEEVNELGEKTGKIIKMPKETAALIIAQGYQATGGLIKISAPFSRVSRFFKYGPKESKQGDKSKRPFIEEHNPPASTIGATLIWAISNNKTKEIFPYIKRNYFQTQLSKASDYLLDVAMLDKRLPKGTSILDNSIIRLAIAGINLNNIIDPVTGKTEAEVFNVGVSSKYRNNPNVIAFQNSLIEDQILNELDPKEARELLNEYLKLAPQKTKAGKFSKSVLSESKVLNLDGDLSMQELLGKAASIDEALSIARDINAPVKKIRVFDFDDTLATTKSDVLFTAPDGTEGKLNAEEFAKQGKELLDDGYVFDFSEFNKVTKGKPGPLLDIAKKIQAARGTEDVFVLTARAAEAQPAIKEFLDSVGLNIPLKNITGLGNSTGEAKANWMVDKAAEGYNDFYFADDAYQNVKAVRAVMSVVDVKSKVQQAKFSKSKNISSDFNKLIEESTGIGAEKVFSDVKAQVRGSKAKRQRFFIPPSAEDMLGLVYTTLGKGKKGEAHLKFYQENLFDPILKQWKIYLLIELT